MGIQGGGECICRVFVGKYKDDICWGFKGFLIDIKGGCICRVFVVEILILWLKRENKTYFSSLIHL